MTTDLSSIYAGLKLVEAPALEPLSLSDAALYLRLASDNGGPVDQDLLGFLTEARQKCETLLRRAFLTQTWQLSLKNWPGRDYQNWPQNIPSDLDQYYRYNYIPLPMAAPLDSVSSVTYLDTSASSSTMPPGNVAGGYNVDQNFEPGRIVLPFSQIWPTTILLPGAPIQIVYVCGYPDVDTWQSQFEGANAAIQGIKLILTYRYVYKVPSIESNESLAGALDDLLGPYRIHE
jgi:hypothetical protein